MPLLLAYGAFSGVVYSVMMDVWDAMYLEGGVFVWARYIASVTSSVRFTVIYAVSNVVFLLLLQKPIGRKLERIKTKYGL